MYPYSEIGKEVIETETIRDGVQMAKEGNLIFLTDKSYFSQISAKDCELMIAKEEFFPTNYGWPFPKGTQYIQKFNDR